MQGKVGRYLTKTYLFIYFKCCYKFYSNIVNLQFTVFTIIFVYNKWKNKSKPNLLRSLTSTSTASSIIQLVLTCKRQKKKKSAQLTEKNFQADKKKNHH